MLRELVACGIISVLKTDLFYYFFFFNSNRLIPYLAIMVIAYRRPLISCYISSGIMRAGKAGEASPR